MHIHRSNYEEIELIISFITKKNIRIELLKSY